MLVAELIAQLSKFAWNEEVRIRISGDWYAIKDTHRRTREPIYVAIVAEEEVDG